MAVSSLTRTLGEFVGAARYDELPADVIAEARIRLLDTLGCAIAGRRNVTTALGGAWASAFAGAGPSSAWFHGAQVTPQDAAFANSVFVHSILHEDAGRSGHVACNVIPSALAAAEAERGGGRELLVAIAIGYELQARIAAGGATFHGFRGRPTGLTGTFGALGAAAIPMRLSAEEATNAIAIAASLCAPGIEQPLLEGSFERCLQMGQLTRSGVTAAQLASTGFAGAVRALEGERGFYASFCEQPTPAAAITDQLGSRWLSLEQFIYKPYPTAALNTGSTYCMEQVVKDPGFRLDDIARVRVRQAWWNRNTYYLYGGPFETIEQALLSCPFAIATVAVYGEHNWPNVLRALDDPLVGELAAKVAVEGAVSSTWNRYESAEVEVELTDGTTVSYATDRLPAERVALDWPGAVAKFETLTAPELGPAEQRALIDFIQGIETASTLEPLCTVMRDGPWHDASRVSHLESESAWK
jgi:2-methylcitrate dehydratase PrpD